MSDNRSLVYCSLTGLALSVPAVLLIVWGMSWYDLDKDADDDVWVIRSLEVGMMSQELIDPDTGKRLDFVEYDFRCEKGELEFLVSKYATSAFEKLEVGIRFELTEEAENRVLDAIKSQKYGVPYVEFEKGEVQILDEKF